MNEATYSPSGVVVLGCGFMGSAIAKVIAQAGFKVNVWNRTFQKAKALESENISPKRTIEDACAGVSVIVACVRSYADLRQLVEQVDLNDKALVNVTTGTSAQAQDMANRVTAAGGRYLDGAIICYPDNIGTDRGRVLVSGDKRTWDEVRDVITALGRGVRWAGEEVSLANVVDSAVVGGFHISVLLAFAEAGNYALRKGVAPELFQDVVQGTLQNIPDRLASVRAAIQDNNFETDQATLATYASAMREFVSGIEADGFRVPLMRSSSIILNEAESRGLGDLGIAATVQPK